MNEFLRQLLFLPEQASSIASDIDHLHYFVIITTMIASTAVGLTAIFFFVRYRRRSERQLTPHVRATWRSEVFFIGVPLTFFLWWFALGYRDFVRLSTPPPDAMDVYVMGKQWMWKFAYPDGPNGLEVLRVPAGRPVRLLITSRDVIHSFYVPAFRIKQDAIPGRYTQAWFEAVKPGRYEVLCAEYCGLQHSMMRGAVVVLEPHLFDEWMDAQLMTPELSERQDSAPAGGVEPWTEGSLVAQGERLAALKGCFRCHTIDGTVHTAPTWLGLYGRRELLQSGETVLVDEPYLTESMMDPLAKIVAGFDPIMPSFFGRLTATETAALVEYIKALSTDPPRVRGLGPARLPAVGSPRLPERGPLTNPYLEPPADVRPGE